MSGSSKSVQWNAFVRRLDLDLYSHPKEFHGMESEPMLTPREKSPLPQAQRKIEPATLQHAGQPAKHNVTVFFTPSRLFLNSLHGSIKGNMMHFCLLGINLITSPINM